MRANEETNPFTLDFGREPGEMIPRATAMEELTRAFSAKNPSQHISMITGVRGSGKTVFMTEVTRWFASDERWTVIELSPEQDLMQSLVTNLRSEKRLAKFFQRTQMNVSYLGMGLKVEGSGPASAPEIELEQSLETMKKRGRSLLIAIDEVVNNASIRLFASIFQIMLRKDLPIFLLMTGLYENIRSLQDQKTLTFLYRAPRIALQPLNLGVMADSYQRIFEMNREDAVQMARETKGYSFAFQVLGYFTWQHPNDPARVRQLYRQYLEEYVYEKIWTEMSRTDQKVAAAMARVPDGSIREIRGLLGMDNNQFNPYRMRLIRKGIADGGTYGVLHFTLPLFDSFVMENTYPE